MEKEIKKFVGISTSIMIFLSTFFVDFMVNMCFDYFFGDPISFSIFEIIFNLVVLLAVTLIFHKMFKWRCYEIDICKEELDTKISNLKKEKVLVHNNVYFIYRGMISMLGYNKVIIICDEEKATVIGNEYYLYTYLNKG